MIKTKKRGARQSAWWYLLFDVVCFFFLLFTLLWSIRKALENRTNMEDDRVAILEAQVAQAKLIAEEADKKYEEV